MTTNQLRGFKNCFEDKASVTVSIIAPFNMLTTIYSKCVPFRTTPPLTTRYQNAPFHMFVYN